MTFHRGIRAVALTLALCAVMTGVGQAVAVDIVGTWKGTLETQIGTVPVEISIETASPVSGKAALGEYGGKIEQGSVEGDKVSFVVNIEHGTLKFDGVVAGDEIRLTVIGTQGDRMALVVKRQKSTK